MNWHRFTTGCFSGVVLVGAYTTALADPPCRFLTTTDAGVIQSVALSLDAGKRYRVWTQSTSSGGDPVLHWIAQEPTSPYQFLHVTSNDDHGSPSATCSAVPAPSDMTSADSCMQYKNDGTSSQESVVILHAYRRIYSGTTRLIVKRLDDNTTVYDETFTFAGDAKDEYEDEQEVEWDEDDRFDYAFTAEGMLYPDILFLNGSAHLAGWTNSNIDGTSHGGWWGQPRLRMDAATGPHTVGKGPHMIVMGNAFPYYGMGNGSGILFRNDVILGDTDDDGLGDGLEECLGTDPEDIDSDEDGFTDALETIGGAHHPECVDTEAEQGITADDPGAGCSINLGTFGADPLVPTVFVTMIWMLEEDEDDPVNLTTLSEGIDEMKAAFAAPEGVYGSSKPVLELLIDYGQETLGPFAAGGGRLHYQDPFCQYPAASPTCGVTGTVSCTTVNDCPDPKENWQCISDVCIRAECDDICNIYDAENLHPTLGDPHVPWNLTSIYWADEPLFPLNRRGLSIPMVAYPQNVGGYYNDFEYPGPVFADGVCDGLECGTSASPGKRKILPGLLLIKQSYISEASLMMHEIGHALRLGHSVDPDISGHQPNHMSVMNYDFDSLLGNNHLLDYGDERPSLTMLGQEIEEASSENECCCGESPCVADWASDSPPVDCCPTCGELNESTQMCEICLVKAWAENPLVACIYGDEIHVGVTEEECCCGAAPCVYTVIQTPKNWCPPTTTYDDINPFDPKCRVCNTVWANDVCYYGGLDEGDGIGDNPTVDTLTHTGIVNSIGCLNLLPSGSSPIGSVGVSVIDNQIVPYNIDWNLTNSVATENPVPPNDLAFRHIGACNSTITPVTATLDTHNEWEFLFNHLAIPFAGTQGLGLPPFCDSNFGCPEGWECTSCGWCADPPNVVIPNACVTALNDTPVACSTSETEEP